MANIGLARSEILCFTQNNCYPRANLEHCLCGFYNNEELLKAKNDLFEIAADLNQNKGLKLQLPRNIARRSTGEAKKRDDVNDLLDLWEILDGAQVNLPTFYACDLKRLPPIALSNTDLCSLIVGVLETKTQTSTLLNNLETGIETVVRKMREMFDFMNDKNDKFNTTLNSFGSKMEESTTALRNLSTAPLRPNRAPEHIQDNTFSQGCADNQDLPSGRQHISSLSNANLIPKATVARTYSSVAATRGLEVRRSSNNRNGTDENNVDGYTLVSRRRQPKPPKLRGTMAETSECKIQSAPRPPPRITIYVGRLKKDTSEEALTDYLLENGVKEPRCRLLVARDGRTFKTAAFMVSCEEASKETFYNADIWPSGCELRDWIFYSRNDRKDTVEIIT